MDILTAHLYDSRDAHEFWTSGTSRGVLSADNPAWCASKSFIKNIKIAEKGDYEFPNKRR
jgi:hypothetical protein